MIQDGDDSPARIGNKEPTQESVAGGLVETCGLAAVHRGGQYLGRCRALTLAERRQGLPQVVGLARAGSPLEIVNLILCQLWSHLDARGQVRKQFWMIESELLG